MSALWRLFGGGRRAARDYRALKARSAAEGLPAVEKEVWDLQKRCFLRLGIGDVSVARPLLDIAALSFDIDVAARQWIPATTDALVFTAAVQALEVAEARKGGSLPEDLLPRVQEMADRAGYAAHRSGVPLAAAMLVENLTNNLLGDRMYARELSEVLRRHDPITELRQIKGTLDRRLGHLRADQPRGTSPALLRQQVERQFLSDLQASARLGPEGYVLTASVPVHAVHGASTTGRSVLYVIPGPGAGALVRLDAPETGRDLCDSVEAPLLSLERVRAQTAEIRRVLAGGERRTRIIDQAVTAALEQAAAAVWEPALRAWPDLLDSKVALVPLSESALLPLYTAPVGGVPVCARTDLTIAPSGSALMMAGLWPEPETLDVLVAADPGLDGDPIPMVVPEAERIAAVHGVDPWIVGRPETMPAHGGQTRRSARGPRPDARSTPDSGLLERLSKASLAHLACHGTLDPHQPLDSALALGGQIPLRAFLEKDLRPGTTLVLSACHLASIDTAHAAEQLGFPGALLAAGARSVIAALWPIPDAPATADLMTGLHHALKGRSPSVALGERIGAAAASGVRPDLWAPLACFGG
ncbi:CHAT domain-containing protein [Spirillospora sp. CA-253888]